MQARREVSNPVPDVGRARASKASAAQRATSRFLGWSYVASDAAVATASVVLAFLITNLNSLPVDARGFLSLRISIKNLLVMVIFDAVWVALFRAFELYDKRFGLYPNWRLLAAIACGTSCALLFVITSRAGAFKVDAVLLFGVIACLLTLSARFVLRTLTEPIFSGKAPRQVLIVGSGARAERVASELNLFGGLNYRVLGFVDNPGPHAITPDLQRQLLGRLSQLENIIIHSRVDEVLITLPVKSCYEEVERAIEICERTGVECKYLSDIFRPSSAHPIAEEIIGFSVTSLKPTRSDFRFIIKRIFDIVASTFGLIFLAPLFGVIALAIKLTSTGPIIFSQERHGRNRQRFRMYKFRTMVVTAEQMQAFLEPRNEAAGPVFKIKNDPRVTRLGMFLRRSSLDELPQLINILMGDMSLVGPRPLPVRDVSKFEEGRLLRRFCVVPGLTGLWQVNARNSIRFEDWVRQDFDYIDNWSLRLDFQILLRTIPAVLKGVGAV